MCGISAPSELLFSKAGEVVAARRSSIKPKNVDMILFFNKNFLCFGIAQCIIEFFFVWGRVGGGQYGMDRTESPLPGIRSPLIRICNGECGAC